MPQTALSIVRGRRYTSLKIRQDSIHIGLGKVVFIKPFLGTFTIGLVNLYGGSTTALSYWFI